MIEKFYATHIKTTLDVSVSNARKPKQRASRTRKMPGRRHRRPSTETRLHSSVKTPERVSPRTACRFAAPLGVALRFAPAITLPDSW
jgi:hypothetical protein